MPKTLKTKITFKSVLIIALFISIGFIPQVIKETKAQTDVLNVLGWAWSGNYGWVALFCNPEDSAFPYDCGAGTNPAASSYGVTVDPVSGIIGGFAWSSNIGWISFDYEENTTDGAPPADDPEEDLDSPCYQGGTEENPHCTAWFDKSDIYEDDNGVTYGRIKGWARIIALRDHNSTGWLRLRGIINMSGNPEYGTGISFALEEQEEGSEELEGSNWDGFGWAEDDGMGFLDFNPGVEGAEFGGIAYKAPFLETESGDIYAKEGVGTTQTFAPPPGYYSATYLIQSGGDIINFCTTAGEVEDPDLIYCGGVGPDIDTEFLNFRLGEEGYPDPFSPPLAVNRYTNVMGKLDVVGLTTSSAGENKFGNAVNTFSGNQDESILQNWDSDTALKNEVYHVQGDLAIGSELLIKKGNTVYNPHAAGTVVVDGDLYINKNVTYESGTVTALTDIPSIAWIVKGSVCIDPEVSDVVGTFIAVGKDEQDLIGEMDPATSNCSDPSELTGGFHTGGGGTQTLNIGGMIIAYEIFLERSYTATLPLVEPAEQITYDGRAIVNTPPGLFDFAAALPILREVAPIEASP